MSTTSSLQKTLWRQFGAAIDTLENVIRACPESLWSDRSRRPEFWYIAYHTIFWLDLYMSEGESEKDFRPPTPYTLTELDPDGRPERIYTLAELMDYLRYSRRKCKESIARLTDESAHNRVAPMRPQLTQLELHMYTMRHVQHHAAQLNLVLRQVTDSATGWVSKTQEPL